MSSHWNDTEQNSIFPNDLESERDLLEIWEHHYSWNIHHKTLQK